MKKLVFWFIVVFAIGFLGGTIKGRTKTFTVEKIKEVIVYDYTQYPLNTAIAVLSLYNMKAVGNEEVEAIRAEGYVEGYREAIYKWAK